ncbi:MAG: SGNH/GDSL hydrolase family protein [Methylocapsa sp.]|nr:SGNH/GDSL hydrolase family protein [Methylocapsa sp.]
MKAGSCKAMFATVLAFVFMAPHASFGASLLVVAFGDSLIDAGTYSPFAKALFGGGRFTTNPGLNFAQDVALHYGSSLTPAFVGGFGKPLAPAGGLDYAQGGSRVTMQPGIGHAPPGTKNPDYAAETTVPVKDQVAAYLAAHGRFNPGQLVLINGGANDVFFQLAAAEKAGTQEALLAALKAIAQSAVDLAEIVDTLAAHGATQIVVMNLPDIGSTPFGVFSPDHGQLLREASLLFNATLAAALPFDQYRYRANITLIDAFSFADRTIANFRTFGFSASNTALACNLEAQVGKAKRLGLPDPSQFATSLFCSPQTYVAPGAAYSFMFADGVHPTTHLNALFALFVEQQIAGKIW